MAQGNCSMLGISIGLEMARKNGEWTHERGKRRTKEHVSPLSVLKI